MKLQSLFPNTVTILVTVITFTVLNIGCKKNTTEQTVTAVLLDSIVEANSNMHYVYDNLNRVIEDRYQIGDTLQERNTYLYAGNDSSPIQRKHFFRYSNVPNDISIFQYNGNHKKIYDSTYSTTNNYYVTAKINYYAPNKISVIQDHYFSVPTVHNWFADTLYLNNAGNVDSIRTYMGASQTSFGIWNYLSTTKYTQYDTHDNIFISMSTGSCNFYPLTSLNRGTYSTTTFYPVIDNFNLNNNSTITTFQNNIQTINYQKQIQYNTDNFPNTETIAYSQATGYVNTKQYRFVYH